jgi:glycosyltransferase 2 family protein
MMRNSNHKIQVIKRKIILDTLKYLLFFGAGLALFLWVYKGQKLDNIWEGIAGFNYWWIIASFIAFIFSHLFRALRWRMLIQSMGFKPRLDNVFLSILVMYLANLALPRMGEVTRCGIVKKYDGVPFTSLLGTVLVERVVDVIFLLLMLTGVLLLDWDVLSSFLHPDNVSGSDKFSFLTSGWFLGLVAGLILVLVLVFIFRRRILHQSFTQKLLAYFRKFVEGLKSVFNLHRPMQFVLLTIAIYSCYYLSTLFVMKAFSPTASLSPMVALAVLTFGSVGMVLPVQGGIGPFDYFAINTFILYKVTVPDSQLVTLVMHGSTTLFIILVGAIALAILPIVNRKRKAAS